MPPSREFGRPNEGERGESGARGGGERGRGGPVHSIRYTAVDQSESKGSNMLHTSRWNCSVVCTPIQGEPIIGGHYSSRNIFYSTDVGPDVRVSRRRHYSAETDHAIQAHRYLVCRVSGCLFTPPFAVKAALVDTNPRQHPNANSATFTPTIATKTADRSNQNLEKLLERSLSHAGRPVCRIAHEVRDVSTCDDTGDNKTARASEAASGKKRGAANDGAWCGTLHKGSCCFVRGGRARATLCMYCTRICYVTSLQAVVYIRACCATGSAISQSI